MPDTPTADDPVVIDASQPVEDEFGTAIVTRIAAERGTDPASLPPLCDCIDPDVLDQFRASESQSAVTVSFEYAGYEVLVTGEGVIQLWPRG